MADTKITDLTDAGGATASDFLYIVDGATSKYIQFDDFESSITHTNITAGDGSDHADVATNTTHRGLTNNPHNILLDQVGNPSTNKTFNMANKGLAFDFTNPTGAGGGFDGAFNIEANGAFTGDLLHIHQHTGNPGAGTHMIHCESSSSNVIPMMITSTHATGIDMGTSKIVALVDPTSNQEAATKKYVDDNLHAQSHNIASHSDTTATGTELNTLTDTSDADGLHAHATNDAKVSFTKTNVKGHIEHGGTGGTGRPSGFTSVEWIGTVEPTNAVNGDTWIDTS